MEENNFKRPVVYNESAVLLYLIGLEISNLLKEIRSKSPQASKYLPEDTLITPAQIQEAVDDFTGFVKLAISVVARRQGVLNYIIAQLDEIEIYRNRLEDAIAVVLQSQKQAPASALEDLYKFIDKLRDQEDYLSDMQAKFADIGSEINNLLEQHSIAWRAHQKKYAEKVIEELEKHDVKLNDLERAELLAPKRTIAEIVESLQKIGITDV